MRYRPLISSALTALLIFAALPGRAPAQTEPGKMIGAAPIGGPVGAPKGPPPAGAKSGAPAPGKPAESPSAGTQTGKPVESTKDDTDPGVSESGKIDAPIFKQAKEEPITPNDYELYLQKGHRGKWDEWIKPGFDSFDQESFATAAIFLNRAYEGGCRDPMVLFRLGIYKESRGEEKEAARMLAEAAAGAAKRYPNHPLSRSIHRHAGRALYKTDEFKEALPHLKDALEIEPDDFMLLLMIGQIERMEGNRKEARKYFEKALKAKMPEGTKPDPKSTILGELIIITYDAGEMDACQKYVDQALKHDPKDKVAKRYKSILDRERVRQKELEIIKSMTE